MDETTIKNICTCGRKNETHPSDHACGCPVWGVHHGLIKSPENH